ncbi:NAD(P)-binding protein [Algirhabdus cladophorae]|uniref:NAD(P)-binding protein n=1 Tax=Algirhabdus cladophorae TaxID=3377108 RepID=UPI003B845425
MDVTANIAIIGGGISGLSLAYTLSNADNFKGHITVFERSATLGGNADTARVHLGYDHQNGIEFTRLADLGVNDINLGSYPKTRAAMQDIGYLPSDGTLGDPSDDATFLCPLEDTVCFFTPDSEEIWTKDSFLMDTSVEDRAAVVDMRFSLDHPDHKILKEAEASFMKTAAMDYADENAGAEYWDFTTAEYVAYYAQRHVVPPEILEKVTRLFLLPRISAMYFADEVNGAAQMPFRGVMSYYRLQEGFGTDLDADRRYFKYGSQHWINFLAKHLESEHDVKIVRNFDARIVGDGKDGVLVYSFFDGQPSQSAPLPFDKVVMAAHADHQVDSFMPSDDPLLDDEMAQKMRSIRYSASLSVAHTYAGLLPANVDSWRTYNVMIRDPDDTALPHPYQMTYVQNRHRNDRLDKAFNTYGLPTYFVSLNPQEKIPAKYILDVTEEDRARRIAERPGYSTTLSADYDRADKAIAYFRHTVITKNLLDIQKELPAYQGMAGGRVYFVGCWTLGAGLHEECFKQAGLVAEDILSPQPT